MKRCPKCGGELESREDGKFFCASCNKLFAVKAPTETAETVDTEAVNVCNVEDDVANVASVAVGLPDEGVENADGMTDGGAAEAEQNDADTVAESDGASQGAEECEIAASESASEDIPYAEEKTADYVKSKKKAEIYSTAGRTVYQNAMQFLFPCTTIFFALLMFCFMAAPAVDGLFLRFTGYELVEMGKILEVIENGYGSSAFIVSMAAILMSAGIAQLVLSILDVQNKRIKYIFYVAQMVIYACLFVAACVLIGGANKEVQAGGGAAAALSFVMIWFAGSPFLYVATITNDGEEFKTHIVTYLIAVKTKTAEFVAKVKAKNAERAAAQREKEQAAMCANNAAFGATGYGGDVLEPSYPVAEVSYDDGDEFIEESSEPIAAYSFGGVGMVYSAKYDLSFDDVIESIWVRGRYALYRAAAFLVMLITSVMNLIYYGASVLGGGAFNTISVICYGVLIPVSLIGFIIALVSGKKDIGRIPFNIIYTLSYFAFIGMFATSQALDYSFSASYLAAGLIYPILAIIFSPIFFGLGMGHHYDKKVPLTSRESRTQKIVTGVLCAALAFASLGPAFALAADPLRKADRIVIGSNIYDVEDLMGSPDMRLDNEYWYFNSSASGIAAELDDLYERLETVGSESEFNDILYQIDNLTYELEYSLKEYVRIIFSDGDFVEAVEYNADCYSYGYGDGIFENGFNDKSYDSYGNRINLQNHGSGGLYLYADISYYDGSWRKGYYPAEITDMNYSEYSGTMEIYYTSSELQYSSRDSKTISEWQNTGFTNIVDYYNDNFADGLSGNVPIGKDKANEYYSGTNEYSVYINEHYTSVTTESDGSKFYECTHAIYEYEAEFLKIKSNSAITLAYIYINEGSSGSYLNVYKNGVRTNHYNGSSYSSQGDVITITLESGDELVFAYDNNDAYSSNEVFVGFLVSPTEYLKADDFYRSGADYNVYINNNYTEATWYSDNSSEYFVELTFPNCETEMLKVTAQRELLVTYRYKVSGVSSNNTLTVKNGGSVFNTNGSTSYVTKTANVNSGEELIFSYFAANSGYSVYVDILSITYPGQNAVAGTDYTVTKSSQCSVSGNTYTSTNKSDSSDNEFLTVYAVNDIIVSFTSTVSSEAKYDYLIVTAGGTEIVKIAGSETVTKEITLAAGQYLRCKYKKDGSQLSGNDNGTITINSVVLV